jgi:L-lactate dehydrogenase complex protein LldG
MTSLSARGEILGRIRAALQDVPHDEPVAWDPDRDRDPASAYRRSDRRARAKLTTLFAERCADYRANVVRCADTDDAIAGAVRDACTRHHAKSLVLPADLALAWVPRGVKRLRDDPPLSFAALDDADGVLTACAHAIADTGTIVLDAGPGQGRRAITLVGDLHICVVRAGQIHAGVPGAVAAFGATVRALHSPITLISGPSATSDIELQRVEGVHGPRRLEVILAG